jgi:MFS family permease
VNKWLRWLLRLDQPVPQLGEEELASLVERHYRWNFSVNLVEGSAFFLGLGFLSSSTIVPLFITKLTASPWPVGLAAMLGQAGWFLPQLVSANWIERLPRRKPVAVNLGLLLEQLPTWLLVIPAFLASTWAGLALVLFLAILAWRNLGGGLVAPAWQDMIARVIPVRRRGLFWGSTALIGTLLGTAAAALAAWLLGAVPFGLNFAVIFALAALVFTSGWFFMATTREPPHPVRRPRQSQREFLAGLPVLLRADAPFRRFLVAYGLLGLGGMALGFVAVSAIQRFGVADSTVALYTGALLLGQGLGSLAFGLYADRHGHKSALEWAAGLFTLAFVLAWLVPAASWYFPVFFTLGVALGTRLNSGLLVVWEFCEPQRRPTYIGVASTAMGLVSIAGPLVAASLAGVSYRLLFAVSAAINLAALGTLRWWVQEPRSSLPAPLHLAPVGETVPASAPSDAAEAMGGRRSEERNH